MLEETYHAAMDSERGGTELAEETIWGKVPAANSVAPVLKRNSTTVLIITNVDDE